MDYLTQIKPLEDQGLTDQQVADTLKAKGVTRKKIDRAALLDLLNKLRVLRKVVASEGESSVWFGSALKMKAAIVASGNQPFVDSFEEWFSHITNPTNEFWDTTQEQWAAPFFAMFVTFADQPNMPTSTDFLAIAELGGGFRYAETESTAIAASRAQYEDGLRVDAIEALKAEIENNWINPAEADPNETAETVRAAIKAGL